MRRNLKHKIFKKALVLLLTPLLISGCVPNKNNDKQDDKTNSPTNPWTVKPIETNPDNPKAKEIPVCSRNLKTETLRTPDNTEKEEREVDDYHSFKVSCFFEPDYFNENNYLNNSANNLEDKKTYLLNQAKQTWTFQQRNQKDYEKSLESFEEIAQQTENENIVSEIQPSLASVSLMPDNIKLFYLMHWNLILKNNQKNYKQWTQKDQVDKLKAIFDNLWTNNKLIFNLNNFSSQETNTDFEYWFNYDDHIKFLEEDPEPVKVDLGIKVVEITPPKKDKVTENNFKVLIDLLKDIKNQKDKFNEWYKQKYQH